MNIVLSYYICSNLLYGKRKLIHKVGPQHMPTAEGTERCTATAKSLQSCPTLFRPHPWDSTGKNTGVGCHFLIQCMKVKMKMKSITHIQLLATPWASAYQAPPSMGFSRQEYWSGVPLPPLIHVPVTSNSSTLLTSIFILDIRAGAY